jgi:two-component system chemotaxis response regulator CheY
MDIVSQHIEESLVSEVISLKEKRTTAQCLHFHLSKLNAKSKNFETQALLNAAKEGLHNIEGTIYPCSDLDLFMIFKMSDPEPLRQVITNLRFFYANDPLACGSEEEGISRFVTSYQLPKDYENFFFICNRKLLAFQAEEEKRRKKKQEIISIQVEQHLWKNALYNRAHRQSLCILLIEDQAFSRQLLKDSLSKEYITLAAKDATEGLYLYSLNAPDIVFLDIELPDHSGHEVLHHLLNFDPLAFIVMTTASSDSDDVKRAIAEGARGYIVKPFTLQKINQYVTMYLTQFKAKGSR